MSPETPKIGSPSLSAALRHWKTVLLWIAVAATVLGVALEGMRQIERRMLEQEAERIALGYAAYIVKSVPDLERLFGERHLSVPARYALIRSRELGDVFRFKLFDRDGGTLIVSDNLSRPDPIDRSGGEALGEHHRNTNVREIVLGGDNHVILKDGRAKADRPEWYTEAYVPLMGPSGLYGVIEVYVDQTALRSSATLAFQKVAALVLGLLMIAAGGVAWQAYQRMRDRRAGAERVRYLAAHDPLSGALNRTSFTQKLESALQNATDGSRFAIHCIDLDRFKEVNDTLGHAAGDAVLQEVARRLQAICRPGDAIARLGGDEFAMLQAAAPSDEAVERCGQSIVTSLASPVEFNGLRILAGASVGAAIYGVDASEVEPLLHRADLAMYRSKTTGRGRFSFYDATLDHELEDRRLLALDLRNALADKTLSLHYQPLFDSDDATQPSGYEALMRWRHPTRGNISPGVFIPIAEEIGEIEALGTWAIERACHDALAWPTGRRVAVNLSPAQFREGTADVVEVVAAVLSSTGLAPERLELEITESLLINDTDRVLDSLRRLSALGVRIAMDDFGTGYSSLSYLWRFPFDKVKIDRAFTMGIDEDNRAELIVASIISLAHALGIRVNAEGVETESQRDALCRLGCDELQGFLLGRPGPVRRDDDQAEAA